MEISSAIVQTTQQQYKNRQWQPLLEMLSAPPSTEVLARTQPTVAFQWSLLLATIGSTYARYTGQQQYRTAALERLAALPSKILVQVAPVLQIEYYTLSGNLQTAIGNVAAATLTLSTAKIMAKQRRDTPGVLDVLVAEARLYIHQNDFAKAHEYSVQAQQLLHNADPYWVAVVYNLTAQIDIKRQQYDSLQQWATAALTAARAAEEVEQEVIALNHLAIVAGIDSDYKKAMELLLEALDKSERIEYRYQSAQLLINIATIYAQLYNYNEALQRYLYVINHYFSVLEPNFQIIVHNNVGNIYLSLQDWQASLANYEQSLLLAQQYHYKEMTAQALAQLCRIHLALGDISKATVYAQQAQALYEQLGDIYGVQIQYLNMARLHKAQKDTKNAIAWAQESKLAARRKRDSKTVMSVYQFLADVYKDQQDFENALYFTQKFVHLREEHTGMQLSRQVVNIEIQQAIQERQLRIEQLTKENEYQALLLKQSDQIAYQNELLRQANEELQQFAYVASHDFKEPLRMIGNFTQIIHKEIGATLDTEQQSYFGYVQDGVKRLNELLDALLKYATVGYVEAEAEPQDVNIIVEMVLLNLRVLLQETGTQICTPTLPTVIAPKVLLIQLFQNLLSNAIKFRKPHTSPNVILHYERQAQQHLFGIQDNGIGIREEDRDRIFIMFQRGYKKGAYEGAGIGLTICQKIIQKLGGKIWLTSEEGVGTTFYFTLPVIPAAE